MISPGAGQKKVVIVQPISNGRFTIIPQEQQSTGNTATMSGQRYFIVIVLFRITDKRICQSFLENMGGNTWTFSTFSDNFAEWRRSSDSGGHEVCLLDIIDGHLLDDGGSSTSDNFHDTDGNQREYQIHI